MNFVFEKNLIDKLFGTVTKILFQKIFCKNIFAVICFDIVQKHFFQEKLHDEFFGIQLGQQSVSHWSFRINHVVDLSSKSLITLYLLRYVALHSLNKVLYLLK